VIPFKIESSDEDTPVYESSSSSSDEIKTEDVQDFLTPKNQKVAHSFSLESDKIELDDYV
jgi:hypothetical protein